MNFFIFCIIGYLVGSIPTGFLLTKFSSGIDLREFGSNSTGATNVLRSGNKKLAFLTLLIDVSKGFILTVLLLLFAEGYNIFASAFCCLIGHSYPIWLKFKGGKGAATAAGIFLAISPIAALISIAIWLTIVKFVKISSIASLSLGASFSIISFYKYLNGTSEICVFLFSIFVLCFLIFTHFDNIKRLAHHEETPPI